MRICNKYEIWLNTNWVTVMLPSSVFRKLTNPENTPSQLNSHARRRLRWSWALIVAAVLSLPRPKKALEDSTCCKINSSWRHSPQRLGGLIWKYMEITFCEHLRKISTFPGFQIQPFWSDESLRKSPHQPHSANGQPLNSQLLGKIQ